MLEKLEADEARKKRASIRGFFQSSAAAATSSVRRNNKGQPADWSPDAAWSRGDPRHTGTRGSAAIHAYTPSPKAKRKL